MKIQKGWIVKHSESKLAFNIIGTGLGGKYKIARVPYISTDGRNKEIDIREKTEAEIHAKLISAAPELIESIIGLVHNAGLIKYVSEAKGSLLEQRYSECLDAINKATVSQSCT